MGIESDTEIKAVKDTNNYITFEKVQESLNLSNPKLFKKYLHEVFQDISTQSKNKNFKYISRLIFHDYIKLPIFISDKLFNSFKGHIKEGLLESEFVSGFYQLYMGNFEETTKTIFDLLDFDKDSYVQKEDVKLFLAYLLLDDFNHNKENLSDNETLEKKNQKQMKKLNDIENLINKTFKKNNIQLNDFILILKKNKSDVFLQILCFLYSKKPFSEKSVEYLKSKYMNEEEYLEASKNYILLRKSKKNLIISPSKENDVSFVNRIINKSFSDSYSPKNSNTKENPLIKKYDSTPVKPKKGHHRYGSCGEFVINNYDKYEIKKRDKDENNNIILTTKGDNNLEIDKTYVDIENFLVIYNHKTSWLTNYFLMYGSKLPIIAIVFLLIGIISILFLDIIYMKRLIIKNYRN